MTSKSDSVSTLGCHCTDYTGRPLEPQVHWDATGTTLADASAQWCPSGDPVLICIIGTHWKSTGKPLENHWKTTGSTLTFLQWHSSVHWGLSSRHTGLPLDCNWKSTGSGCWMANGPLYVTSCCSTWIFCRGVSGFATDCPCDVWCRGLTTCLLHVGPPFGNRILNNSWAVGLT